MSAEVHDAAVRVRLANERLVEARVNARQVIKDAQVELAEANRRLAAAQMNAVFRA